MSLFSRLFNDNSDDETIRVRRSNEDNDHLRGDKYKATEDGGHTHQGYNLNASSGEYREYSGGENSGDRSYNKT